jgi:hypothetical protein
MENVGRLFVSVETFVSIDMENEFRTKSVFTILILIETCVKFIATSWFPQEYPLPRERMLIS